MNDDEPARGPTVPTIEKIRYDGLPKPQPYVPTPAIETPWGPARDLGEMMFQWWSKEGQHLSSRDRAEDEECGGLKTFGSLDLRRK